MLLTLQAQVMWESDTPPPSDSTPNQSNPENNDPKSGDAENDTANKSNNT